MLMYSFPEDAYVVLCFALRRRNFARATSKLRSNYEGPSIASFVAATLRQANLQLLTESSHRVPSLASPRHCLVYDHEVHQRSSGSVQFQICSVRTLGRSRKLRGPSWLPVIAHPDRLEECPFVKDRLGVETSE